MSIKQVYRHKKQIVIHIFTFCFLVASLFLLNLTFSQDLMEQAFGPAMSYDAVINLGNTKEAVGDEVLKESVSVGLNDNFGQGCFVNEQFVNIDENQCNEMGGDRNIQAISVSNGSPLIVKIAKFLLRMTIVLSITMIIYNSIAYMVEVLSGKDRKSAESKKNILFVIGGIVLVLMSVSIINLIVAIPKSSVKTSDDLGGFTIGCKTGTTIVEGENLKKWICENSKFGYPENTMEYRERNNGKCNICDEGNTGCKWKQIYRSEMKSKCVSDMGGTVIE